MDLLNELQYNFSTRGARTGERTKDETGNYSPNILDRLLGVSGDDLQSAANSGDLTRFNQSSEGQKARALGLTVTASDMENRGALGLRIEDASQGRTLSRQLRAMGGNPGDVKDPTVLSSMIDDKRRSNDRRDTFQQQSDLFQSPQMREERRIRDEQFKASRDDVARNLELTRLTMQENANNTRLDRAERQDARADELMFRREDAERQDRRADKADRRRLSAELGQGIAALAAAFAI